MARSSTNHGYCHEPRRAPLAIVGMAGRFPDSDSHEELWDLLKAGLDVHRTVPDDRFDVSKYYDPDSKTPNTSHTPFGCWIKEPGLFDPRFFNMSPREAKATDPMHRLSLLTAYEALEQSGYVPGRTPSTKLDRIGTFYGQTSDDWREINAAQDIDTYFIPGGVRAFLPGRISYAFKFTGPSFSVDTACSSSAAAIHIAALSIWAGECDTAVAGGANVMTNSDIFSGLSRGQFLSKTGNCQTFDNSADGYCRGDGVASVVIKRLEDAEADNDVVLGIIRGIATNHSSNASSIVHPHAPTQADLFSRVMRDTCVDPHEVDYVEMHGTGTQAGDSTEMQSVTNVFAPADRLGTRAKPLYIGSVKANVGHGEAVSGVTALVKALLMLDRNMIPPHCGIKGTKNQSFSADLDQRNVNIALQPKSWDAQSEPRKIFINNFSAAGGNTAMLLEGSPARPELDTDRRKHLVIAVSAKSKAALAANTRNLASYLRRNPDCNLSDLSYTTTARRIQHQYRIGLCCDSIESALHHLEETKNVEALEPVSATLPQMAFAYTGQGSHYTALGRDLYDQSSVFRDSLNELNEVSQRHGYESFLPLISGTTPAEDLSPVALQTGLVAVQIALTTWWHSLGIKPNLVVGHSLGEYAALHAAGILTASDTIYLVGERAKLLQQHCSPATHSMLAFKDTVASIDDDLRSYPQISVACMNSSTETVLAGPTNDIETLSSHLHEKGVKCTRLRTQFAFHSAQVDPILEAFEEAASKVAFCKPQVPLLSPLDATVIEDGNRVHAAYLRRHARETVNFGSAIDAAQQAKLVDKRTVWIEIGPNAVCSSFIKSTLGSSTHTTSSLRRNVTPNQTLAESLVTAHSAGFDVDWTEYHRDSAHCVRPLHLPAYAFDNKNYWIPYVGDWNLRKADMAAGKAETPEPNQPKFLSTTVQSVTSEEIKEDRATIVAESDAKDPKLSTAISGHMVNQTPLCPSSIYADQALTLGEYAQSQVWPDTEAVPVGVGSMEVFKPLVLSDTADKQIIRLSAEIDPRHKTGEITFSSGEGANHLQHAKCKLDFSLQESLLSSWQRQMYLIRDRINSLEEAANEGKAHRLLRGMVYKLFGGFVEYDTRFQGMEEVIMAPELEATAKISFQTTDDDGQFNVSPYWIDSVCHLAGFILNANDSIDSTKQVYVSHGWQSMRFAEKLQQHKTYRSYVKMQPMADNIMAGDVYILDGDRIIGLCEALKFQSIPRSLLNTFLPPRGTKATLQSTGPPTLPRTTQAGPKKKAKKEPVRDSGTAAVDQVLNTIALEVGVPITELAEAVEFQNLGVDSLMSLTVSGRIREELNIDFPSSAFADFPTVGDLKGFVLKIASEAITTDQTTDAATTEASFDDSDDVSSTSTQITPPETPPTSDDSRNLSKTLRAIISESMDVDEVELMSIEDLSRSGMDSLMTLTVLAQIRERTALDLPADFFTEHRSIKTMEASLGISPVTKKPKQSTQNENPILSESDRTNTPIEPKPLEPSKKQDFKASSLLLQGKLQTASKQLWLVPDGGGSPTSYSFPLISDKLATWGLVSPFVKTPEKFDVGVPGIATLYIQEMMRRQPTGPYNVGGWSAGGVISYEVTQQLTAAGQMVESLILIDSPPPSIIEPLPSSLHRFFASIGLLGEGDGVLEKLPRWLLPHFASSVRALSTYKAEPLPTDLMTKIWILWCEDGVLKDPATPRPDPYPYGHAQWLLESRTDFGPTEWADFIREDMIEIERVGGNHFTMMQEPLATQVGEFLGRATA